MASIQKKYVGLLGGSFDPAHKGHLGISIIALKKFKLNRIYWVITKKNPFKNKTFHSLDERIKYAKKITKTQKKIKPKCCVFIHFPASSACVSHLPCVSPRLWPRKGKTS